MKAHSVLGASSASRWMTCPGSLRVSQAVTEPAGTSRWAAAGTVAHKIAEELLTKGGPIDRHLGAVFKQDGYDVLVDQDMTEAVEIYLNAIDPIIAEADFWDTELTVSLDRYWKPQKPPVHLFGTCDLFAYTRPRRRLTIVDYKHGAGVYVSHVENAQTMYYGAGALAALSLDEDPLDVEMVIVQPRVPGHEPVRRYTLPVIDILAWVHTELKPAVARTQLPDASLVLGDHCRWCPGRVICPAMLSLQLRSAQKAFSVVAGDDVKDATDADIGEFLNDIESLEIWIDAVKAEGKRRLEEGGRVPGWQLVASRPRRIWSDEQQVIEELTSLGVNNHSIFESKLRSPAQLQKELSDRTWARIAPLIVKHSSGTTLARSAPTLAKPFETVTTEET